MSDTTVLAPPAAQVTRGGRPVRRRQALPTGRAVLGGFLVALSALGTFVAWSGVTKGPEAAYVVAGRDLSIGTRLTAADLRLVPMDLPDALARTAAFDDAESLVGVKVINPIRKGELVQASSLVQPGAAAGALEVSFAIESARAVAGTLKPGEFVDFLATFGAGSDTYTTTVLQGARILDVRSTGGSLGSSDQQVITLEVADAAEARAIAHAVNVAKVTVVRSDASSAKSEQGGTYRAPSSAADS